MIRYILPSIVVFAFAAQIRAAVITDPALATGAGAIAPGGSGYRNLNTNEIPANATQSATLEALAGFGVIQDFAGVKAGSNTIVFTDPARADVQISFRGTAGTDYANDTGGERTTAAWLTSPGAGINIAGRGFTNGSQTSFTMTIDFGSWNGMTFDTAGNMATAAGFTLSGDASRLSQVSSISASFLGVDGSTLSTQTWTGPKDGARGLYFGYQATGTQQIGSIEVTFSLTHVSTGAQMILGFDDLGFTSVSQIPEPSHAGVFTAFGAIVLCVCLRRHLRR
ncbi:MAG: PEP-CTERM sorting domain-containing protein [Opitutaceae bacterium]|jgi:hypothetical protein|nr:PEP-CTERM sorting domain-containing protein [Opitutaceae bacterium]